MLPFHRIPLEKQTPEPRLSGIDGRIYLGNNLLGTTTITNIDFVTTPMIDTNVWRTRFTDWYQWDTVNWTTRITLDAV